MRHKRAAAITAVLVILGGALWEWPVRVLNGLGLVLTALDLRGIYNAFVGWMMKHPDFVVNVAPWLMMGVGVAALFYLFVWPPIHARIYYQPLQILFDNTNRFVRVGADGVTRLFIGVHNARRDSKTIPFVNMRVHDGEFTREVISQTHPYSERSNGDIMLFQPLMLDAGAVHYTEIFAYADGFPPDEPYWKTPHRFTVDARGRDVDIARAEFELDTAARPMLRRIG